MEDIKLDKVLKLKDDFPPHNYEDWKAQAIKDLKGADFDKKLFTPTYEGIKLKPLYTKEDIKSLSFTDNLPGFSNFARGTRPAGYLQQPWIIAQSIPYGLAEDFNRAIKNDLKNGLTGIILPLDNATKLQMDADYKSIGDVGYRGLSISAYRSLERAFDGIDITKHPIFVDAGFSSLPFILLFISMLERKGIDANFISGGITADPLNYLLEYGEMPITWKDSINELTNSIKATRKFGSDFKAIEVSALTLNNSGASAIQELGYALSAGVEYINALSDAGLNTEELVNRIKFKFGIGSFYFMETAKLRAFRMLWEFISKQYGIEGKAFVHAKTTSFNQTKIDPYVNMLRTTTEAFSAVLGGIDLLETNPFDETLGEPDEFSRRIARNTQLILKEEAHLDKLIDPAGGSFYIESLTNEIANKAWEFFQEIEKNGGAFNSIKSGFIQDEIKKVSEKKFKDAAKRKNVLVGTNLYVNTKEKKITKEMVNYQSIYEKRAEYLRDFRTKGANENNTSVLQKLQNIVDDKELINSGIEAFLSAATLGEVTRAIRINYSGKEKVQPLEQRRLAEPFEILRQKSNSIAEKRGKAPSIHLLNFGTLKEYKGRADFSRSYFETAGFDIIYSNGFSSVDEAVAQAANIQADLIVICSTDENYKNFVTTLVKELKSNTKSEVILAGNPQNEIKQYYEAGLDGNIYLGQNVLEFLNSVMTKIENSKIHELERE